MATHFTLKHIFEIDAESFWPKVFFNPDYNRRLYDEALKYKRWELLEQREESGGAIVRRAIMEPNFDAPTLLKKAIGDGVAYTEEGRFDPATKRWRYSITPNRMADKFMTRGEYWVESRGEKKIERICTVDLEAKIFGIGGALESYIEKQTREAYETTCRFTNQFIRDSGF
jgi:Protein of unknown function (DUF2505)